MLGERIPQLNLTKLRVMYHIIQDINKKQFIAAHT